MREIGTPQWDAKNKRWKLGVQRNGKRKWFYSSLSGKTGMRECEEKAHQWLDGGLHTEGFPKVESAVMAWLEEVKTNTGMSSYRQYEGLARNYIIPEIGSLRVDKLKTEQQIQSIINKAFKSGAQGHELSKKTLMNLRGTLTGFLKYCRKCGYTELRPEHLELPRRAKNPDRRILQPKDLQVLFSNNETSRGNNSPNTPKYEWFIHAFRFQVLTGLRPGELIGLKWKDIKKNLCSIRRSINYHGEVTPGKNENARRTFALPKRAADELAAQREMLRENGVESEYVFPRTSGEFVPHKMYRRHLLSYCAFNGIPDICPYELRHTWYSMNKSLPAELVKQMGGHSESMDTFGVYGHEVEGEREQTAELIDDVISRILGMS